MALSSEVDGLLEATKSLLARIPSTTGVDLDAGCAAWRVVCYSKDHYDVSVAIANRKLCRREGHESGEALVAVGRRAGIRWRTSRGPPLSTPRS